MPSDQRPFAVGLIQMRCSNDPEDNLGRATSLLRTAADRGAQVACLPELFRTQYFCQVEDAGKFDLAESIPGPTTSVLGALAKETGMVVIGSVFEPAPQASTTIPQSCSTPTESSVVAIARCTFRTIHFTTRNITSPPATSGFRYSKHHMPESVRLSAGTSGIRKPRGSTALKGASILFYPTAIGWHPREKAEFGAAQTIAWETMQRAHAIANGVFVAAVNRIGHEGPSTGGLEFWGGSFLADPFGGIIARAGEQSEEVLIATCDPRLQEETRRNWPFLRDRRIDTYGPITERFHD